MPQSLESQRLSHDAPAAEIPGPAKIATPGLDRPRSYLARRLLLALPPLALGALVTALALAA
ncbi:hypothetical protein, partial [Methylobacterium goesingense]